MSTEFSLTIKMNDLTYDDRRKNGLNLILMKVVKAASFVTDDARPLSWICLTPDDFGLSTEIKWTESYRAYTSKTKIDAGAEIHVENSYAIELGQQLELTAPSGVGKLKKGQPGSIIISNPLSSKPDDPELTCGIMQSKYDEKKKEYVASQLCAFPLLPNSADIITPINKVFVYFASNVKNTGAVIELCLTQGIMVNFTGANQREISFDKSTGWGLDHPEWTDVVPPGAVIDRLIESSATLALVKNKFDSEKRQEALEKAKKEDLKSFGMNV